MRGFARRTTVEDVLEWVARHSAKLQEESIDSGSAGGRVLASDVVSPINVPGFDRAMMDGYAIRAEDIAGATSYQRHPLEVVDESLPGKGCETKVGPRQAIRIMTGAPMPLGANAVLPAESVEIDEAADRDPATGIPKKVFAVADVAPQKHIGTVGEDIASGTAVFHAGRRLRPQDIGLLASIGVASVEVVRQPVVRLVITGNELLPPGSVPTGFQIVDSNSPMLQGLIERDGGTVEHPGILPDHPDTIREAFEAPADVVIVSGGSSVGVEDHAPRILREIGKLDIHGIAMRPSSPTGMGTIDSKKVFLLPGNPVSCLCAYDFFAGRLIRGLAGRRSDWPYMPTKRTLLRKVNSMVGRVDYARVRLVDDKVEPLAIGGASMLSSTTRADGFIVVSADSEGFAAGTEVDVYQFDRTISP